jgi:hypothetical protein
MKKTRVRLARLSLSPNSVTTNLAVLLGLKSQQRTITSELGKLITPQESKRLLPINEFDTLRNSFNDLLSGLKRPSTCPRYSKGRCLQIRTMKKAMDCDLGMHRHGGESPLYLYLFPPVKGTPKNW